MAEMDELLLSVYIPW